MIVPIIIIIILLIIIWLSIPSSNYSMLRSIRDEQHRTNEKLDRIIRLLDKEVK